ncbi:hypothetical protein KSD_26870 [Ktedonobacter sp. SOSP1-85]|uniref:FIST signal transduction protein n=1 Tax=unclassified Ktedonobacter TaxID=388461 RepID=UPI001915A8CD|nr:MULTISPECIES: FIST N-terminal domain-containing protein [unclassified Ktedonobacter]GHO69050.1 hypothetical protein KSC_079420 [Ktedonobacter sp. SOSP1-52]GHO74916.1 hypothetical protein KSD_26870 [Ktedonobacter sp. SOSP1-85]
MKSGMPVAREAVVADEIWDQALFQALAQTCDIQADVALLFASGEYEEHFPEMLRIIKKETGASIVLGCSGQGIIGTGMELEDVPALSLMTMSLPGATLHATRLPPDIVEMFNTPEELRTLLDVPLDDVNGWLLFLDPFHLNSESLIDALARAYPQVSMMGGLASNDMQDSPCYFFFNDTVYTDGGIGLAIGGPYKILSIVSQGCEPIGEPWTITKVQDNGLIETISNRPAYDMLVDTFQKLSPAAQIRAQRNLLLVGLAADEYSERFGRGSFLIRNLLGVDRRNKALAIGAQPRVGQTIQFQMRDSETADLDLRELLNKLHYRLKKAEAYQVVSGILCTCNGRGESLFPTPNHDAGMVEEILGPLPTIGLFCNGEIGPVGDRPFLHSFTACLALIVKRNE